MEPMSHVRRLNGLDHHVLEWSPSADGDAAVAVLVHGFQSSAATWERVATLLARKGFRVLAPDMRGFGDGPRAPQGSYYYFPDYVADLAAILRSDASATPVFLVGHSMGATIVSYYAGAFPERVAKLALVDGVGPPDVPADAAPARMRQWIELAYESPAQGPKPMSRAEAALRLSRWNPGLSKETLGEAINQVAREVPGGVAWKHDPLHATVSPIPFFAEVYKAFAARVTCPVLYVSGGQAGFQVPGGDARLACFDKLSTVTIEGGHALHWSKPDELAHALVEFWRT